MSNLPLISIVLPVYNVEKFLRESLDSIVNQTFSDFELICVNDGSTDSSLEILNEYKEKDNRIKIITKTNQGLGEARNTGILYTTGKYLLFLDSDDFFEKDMLETLYLKAEETSADITLFRFKTYNYLTNIYGKPEGLSLDILDKEVFSWKDYPNDIFDIAYPNVWTKFYNRQFFINTGLKYPNYRNSEDEYVTLMAFVLANRITYVDNPFTNYRIGRKDNLESNRAKDPTCFLRADYEIYKSLKKHNLYSELENSYINHFIKHMHWALGVLKGNKEAQDIVREEFNKLFVDEVNVFNHNIDLYQNVSYLNKLEKWSSGSLLLEDINNELISVIIPVYNAQKFIGRCIDSLLKQTHTNFEIIIVDDKSTDKSKEIIEKYSQKHKRIRAFYLDNNSGQSTTRNYGIKQAKGDYIAFVDDDDFVDPNYLSILYYYLKKYDVDLSVCNYYQIKDSESNKIIKEALSTEIRVYDKPLDFLAESEWICAVVLWNKLFKKDLFDDINLIPDVFHEDEWLCNKMYSKISNMVYIDKKLYYYIKHNQSLTHNERQENFLDKYNALYERIHLYEDKKMIEGRDRWLKDICVTLRSSYYKSRKMEDSSFWMETFKSRLYMILNSYPHIFENLADGLKYDIKSILNDIKVSVIVPVYNPGIGIKKCIDSITNQSLKEIEIIFIDDHGNDESMKYVYDASIKDSRIRIIDNGKNCGAGYSRNVGIENAKGEYLSFIDADDYISKDFLENLYNEVIKKDYEIVKGVCQRVEFDSSGCEKYIFQNDLNDKLQNVKKKKHPLYRVFYYEHTTAIYQRKFIKSNNIKYGTSSQAEDTLFLLNACHKAKKFSYIDTAVYYHVMRDSSAMHQINDDYINGCLDGLFNLLDYTDKCDLCDSNALEYAWTQFNSNMRFCNRILTQETDKCLSKKYVEGLKRLACKSQLKDKLYDKNIYMKALIDYCENLYCDIFMFSDGYSKQKNDFWLVGLERWKDFLLNHPECGNEYIEGFKKDIEKAKNYFNKQSDVEEYLDKVKKIEGYFEKTYL